MYHRFTQVEIDYITNIAKNKYTKEITTAVNEKFNLQLTDKQIKFAMYSRGIKSGIAHKFEKGNKLGFHFQKGNTIGVRFEKGNIPKNRTEIGHESLDSQGYVVVKIAQPSKTQTKHTLIWEQHNGSVPKGYAVIFGDGDKRNFNIDNLILVTNKQLCALNRYRLIQNDADLTRSGVIIVDLLDKVSQLSKGGKT